MILGVSENNNQNFKTGFSHYGNLAGLPKLGWCVPPPPHPLHPLHV